VNLGYLCRIGELFLPPTSISLCTLPARFTPFREPKSRDSRRLLSRCLDFQIRTIRGYSRFINHAPFLTLWSSAATLEGMARSTYKKKSLDWPPRSCEACGREFSAITSTQKYCSKECRPKPHDWYPGLYLSTSAKGAIAELKVCADLMARGYEVYRAMCQASSSDLVIKRNGVLWTVEVRTAFSIYPVASAKCSYARMRSNFMAAYVPSTGVVVYSPSLPDNGAESAISASAPQP
jgi:hypothetical protein